MAGFSVMIFYGFDCNLDNVFCSAVFYCNYLFICLLSALGAPFEVARWAINLCNK